MKLKIFNTLGREKQIFNPISENEVKIYSCGPTVYSTPHIGNMRACIVANLLSNIIREVLGYKVNHIMNITDVGHLTDDGDDGEDKLEKASKKESKSAYEIAEYYENIFFRYLKDLDLKFDFFPRATKHIQEQIDMILNLEKKGYTYVIENDGIYMDTSKVKDYGKLLPQGHLDGLEQNARIHNDAKKNKTDFALWKFSPINEKRQMERDSPWGKGFPGWHIECSAMSVKYLGEHFDIHSGGIDHIPVHHSNEIAQSECCFDKKRVNYRIHNEHLNLKDDKMSKSKGNIISLDTLSEKGISALHFKYFIYLAHYRNIQIFTYEDISGAKKAYEKTIKKLQKCDLKNINNIPVEELRRIYQDKSSGWELLNFLLDDMDTVKTIAYMNKILSKEDISNQELSLLKFVDEKVLKLHLFEKASEIEQIPQEIIDLANDRLKAKFEKDYDLADKIRQDIDQKGYIILDTKDGFNIDKK